MSTNVPYCEEVQIDLYRGDTIKESYIWTDDDGDPINITGYSARMQVRANEDAAEVLLELTTASGHIVLGGSAGTISIRRIDSIVKNLPAGSYTYDMELTSPAGEVTTRFAGPFVVYQNATQFVAVTPPVVVPPIVVVPPVIIPPPPVIPPRVPNTTLTGRIMAGYQGWHNTPGDGSPFNWRHWSTVRTNIPAPGNVVFDAWPDTSELAPSELYPTAFTYPNGTVASLYTSRNRDTVMRHFKWMRDYNIDGALVQRFGVNLQTGTALTNVSTILGHAKAGANAYGRLYVIAYDLTGMAAGTLVSTILTDWRNMWTSLNLSSDLSYAWHKGKPVVSLFGIGFRDVLGRPYSLAEFRTLVDALKAEGLTVITGVPTNWRTLNGDAGTDPALLDICEASDIVTPWTVGRIRTTSQAASHGTTVQAPDNTWCTSRGLDYLPVCFPGFSWANLQPASALDEIPRLGGNFFWSQVIAAKNAGATMIYAAMFDEVDEGTALFKISPTPPRPGGVRTFIDTEGLPSDHWLFLTGKAGQVLRGEIPANLTLPTR